MFPFTGDGVPTADSYSQSGDAVAKAEGQDPSTVNFAYFKTSETDTQLALAYILEKAKKSRDGKLFPYIAIGNDCADYCVNVLSRAHATAVGSPIPNMPFWELTWSADSISRGSERQPQKSKEESSHIFGVIRDSSPVLSRRAAGSHVSHTKLVVSLGTIDGDSERMRCRSSPTAR